MENKILPVNLILSNVFSKKQAEYFMAHQAVMLGHNQAEALPPDQLQQSIKEILTANPDLAEAHFLSYMNSLRVKEYCTALHNLCHFFDRKACPPGDSSPSKSKKSALVEEIAMRYAALNLASLQFRFGNREECKEALQEAIMLAQEGNDQVCLQHALVWLNLLGESHSGVAQLERSFKKTIDLLLPNLTVHGLNCISKDLGMGTEKPSRVIYFFTQSNLINCMHSSYGMMAAGCAQRAAMWHYYGKRQLCSLDSHIVLHLETSINGVYYNGQAVCIAMCNLAQQHADLGDYSAAAEILSHAKQQFSASTSEADIWQACQQRIAFTRALYTGRLKDAEQALVNLQAVDEPEAKIRQGILLREQGKATQAFDCLVKLLAECDKDKSEFNADFRCRVLLELSSLYFSRGESTSAVLHVSDCVAQAERHHLELLEALATAHLAYIQLNMGLPKQALQLLETRLLRVFTHCSSYDKARVLHLYARCKVGAVKSEASGTPSEITAELQSAASLMLMVTTLYHSVEAHLKEKDALHFQAIIHHMLMGGGNRQHHQEERNRCARQFKGLDRLYPTLGPGGVCLL
ncbi:anaphase-promoting complex subunit 5-like [Elysia marginata]|uniref:Anaphase-promoting complex subunit 5 n=1 Tax=Elysia marginata TaxID=1093978 RepID=A0AAV4EF29_9GAST|nr:anaphase-promoting complex subunit 5-like [Elysia marginata]